LSPHIAVPVAPKRKRREAHAPRQLPRTFVRALL